MKARMSVQTVACLFILSMLLAQIVILSFPETVKGELDGGVVDVNSEYSNGIIGSSDDLTQLWYSWINFNGTQVLYLAYNSSKAPPPVANFFGQRYVTMSGNEVFVGNTLTSMEIYNDTDGNGIPSNESEILYDFALNSSERVDFFPVEKYVVNGIPHYKWGIKYNVIDGFIMAPYQSDDSKVILEYIGFSYDFSVNGNQSSLKTSFAIGKITDVIFGNVSLDNLSLSLLYETTVITAQSHEALVDGQPYDSQTAQASTDPAETGQIQIENEIAYEFIFGQNYTLNDGLQNQTIPAITVGIAKQSIPYGIYRTVENELLFFEKPLNDVFGKISSNSQLIDLNYASSSLMYRVCYPNWSGYPIEHDPEYIAYFNPSAGFIASFPWLILIVASIINCAVLSIAFYDLKRYRKINFLKT